MSLEMSKKLLKYGDLLEIVEWLTVNEFDKSIGLIEIIVPTHDALQKLNEDFFYRSEREEGDENNVPTVGNEMDVTLNGIRFRYVVKDNNRETVNT